jgi:hypothetical protein
MKKLSENKLFRLVFNVAVVASVVVALTSGWKFWGD